MFVSGWRSDNTYAGGHSIGPRPYVRLREKVGAVTTDVSSTRSDIFPDDVGIPLKVLQVQ